MTGQRFDQTARAREEDRIVSLVAQVGSERLDLSSQPGAAYADWLAAEARLATPASERRQDALRGRDLSARVLARRGLERVLDAGLVVRPSTAPVERAAELVLSAAAAVEAADRSRCAPWLELSVAAGPGRELWDQECERWVELPPALPRGRYIALGVTGDSMEPLLVDGDTVLVRLGSGPATGALVVARLADYGYVVKQVGRLTKRTIELRSLNPVHGPIRTRREPDTVLGTVVMVWGRESA